MLMSGTLNVGNWPRKSSPAAWYKVNETGRTGPKNSGPCSGLAGSLTDDKYVGQLLAKCPPNDTVAAANLSPPTLSCSAHDSRSVEMNKTMS